MELYSMELHSMELYSMEFLYLIELRSIPKMFFLNLKGLFNGSVVSSTKNEYGSAVLYFL